MPNESFQEKTEKATPKRRFEARQEGNVARSMEINSAVILLTGTLTLYFMGPWLMGRIRLGMTTIFREAVYVDLTVERMNDFAQLALSYMVINLLPLLFTILLTGITANVVQVGLIFSSKPLKPKLSKINPLKGLKRLVTLRSLLELVKSIIKLTIICYFAYTTIKGDFSNYQQLLDSDITISLAMIGSMAFKLVIKIAVVLLVMAIIDYFYQKWDHERNLKMTKQEVQDESKQTEGDPKVKSRIRSLQRQFMINAMIHELPEADVVITNPVRYAIAIRYNSQAMAAPKVIAKGARKTAERIKKIARQNDIPIVENKELARALYKTVEVGMEVPTRFYQAIAEVLSYVYRLKNKKMD